MLTNKQITFIQEELATAKNPLFLFDDDPDGLCSFILMYKIHREGQGTVVKTIPQITNLFLRKVQERNPDKIFILDMPMVDQEFINAAKRPIFWIDHHQPLERQKVHYFNPRIKKPEAYIPTTRMAYQINQNTQDSWLAMVGCLGDYHLPDFHKEFSEQFPKLLKKKVTIDEAIYQEPIGKLVRVFSFLLKGPIYEVNKCIKILTRIKSPYEILEQETAQGKYLYKRFERIDVKYQALLQQAKKQLNKKTDKPFLIFPYDEQTQSFTSELSNELLHLYSHKIVIVARKKSGEMKCSLRSRHLPVAPALERALIGIEGYGGGHEMACGACIKEEDWQQFLINFERELNA
ncbi:DHH family phosphoesterase [Candidatus Woesearchaeota archaeon]|nr:DHH family phosphoesterase [Candidatus Woesearchaeota archaeon]